MELKDLEKIFQQHKDTVFKTAYLIVGSVQEAEDILQEVFLKVYKSASGFDPQKGSMRTWLHRITVNQCISEKRKRRELSYSSEEMEERGVELADKSNELPEDMAIKTEEVANLWHAIKSMDVKQRAVLTLRYFEGLSYSEIARTLDVPLGTVKSRLNVAIKNLRRLMLGG